MEGEKWGREGSEVWNERKQEAGKQKKLTLSLFFFNKKPSKKPTNKTKQELGVTPADMMAKIMKEPELAAAMQKPQVMKAIMVRQKKKRNGLIFSLSLSLFSPTTGDGDGDGAETIFFNQRTSKKNSKK